MNNRLHTLLQDDLGYNETGKTAFIREARSVLRKTAKALGLGTGQFKISVNKGGIAVSGDVALHTPTFYLTISQHCGNTESVMYRKSKGLTCSGGGSQNHWMDENTLQSEAGLKRLRAMIP
jgi:hypothetical protein